MDINGVLLKVTAFFPVPASFSSLTSMLDKQVKSLSAMRVTVQVDFMSGWSKQGVAYHYQHHDYHSHLELTHPPSISRLHLSSSHVLGLSSNGILVRRSVESSHLVVQLSLVLNSQSDRLAGLNILVESELVGLDVFIVVCGNR